MSNSSIWPIDGVLSSTTTPGQSEIYRRMCDVYGEAWFNQKMFTIRLNMSSSRCDWVKKTVHGVEAHRLSSIEKVLGTVVNQRDHTDSVLGHEMTHLYWFPWKKSKSEQSSQLQTPSVKFTLPSQVGL